jgi:cobalt/nickel transport system permease protein
MHLPDHYLDPVTTAVTTVAAVGAVAVAVRRLRHERNASWRLIGAVAAGIFSGQMVNFPINGGTSGHLVGSALAAILLGPWSGMLAMVLVLTVQAVVFGDGGITALGANLLNMGIVGCLVGRLVYDRALSATGSTSQAARTFAAGFAAWASVVAAAFACAVEVAASGQFAAGEVILATMPVHALIGVAEAVITAAVVLVYSLAIARDVGALSATSLMSQRRATVIGLFAAALVGLILAPLASELPDGLENAIAQLSIGAQIESAPLFSSPLANYSMAGIDTAWATALVGLIGVAIVVALSEALYRGCATPRS